MFKTIVLICLVGMPIEECSIDNALRVISVPEPPTHLGMCMFVGQAYIASGAMGRLTDGEYVKILCKS